MLSFNEIYFIFCLFKIYILYPRSKAVSAGMYSVFFVLGKLLEAPCTILKTKVFIMEVIRKSVAGHWPGGEAGAMLISHGGSFLAPLSLAPFLRTTAT